MSGYETGRAESLWNLGSQLREATPLFDYTLAAKVKTRERVGVTRQSASPSLSQLEEALKFNRCKQVALIGFGSSENAKV